MKNFKSKQLNDVYDLIIKIESIKALFDGGWKIIGTDYGKKCNEKYQKNGSVVVTAIGNKNKGKSFILSKISEKDIPRGFNITTEGLSVIYPRKRPVIILDTSGSESPLLELEDNYYQLRNHENNCEKEKDEYQIIKQKYFDELKSCKNKDDLKEEKKINKELKKKIEKINEDFYNSRFDYINKIKSEDLISQIHNYINEKKITDYFLQRFALEKSNIILLIFGKMTRQDQFFLNRIKRSILNNTSHKFSQKLLVIHNLYNFKEIKDVEKYIDENLKKSDTFSVREQEIRLISEYVKKKKFFKNYFIEEKNEIIHFIMAEEGTEAGDYYNDTVIEYIKCCVCASADLEYFNLLEQLKKFFIEISDQFTSEKLKETDIVKDDVKKIIKVGKKISIKDFSANFLDFTLGNTKVNPNFYDIIENNLYKIIIECPGDSQIKEIKVNYYDRITQISISGIKNLNIPDNSNFLGGNKLSSGSFNIIKNIAEHKKESNIDDQDIEVKYTNEGFIECIFKINEE
jgi:hypothetical protein